VFSHSVGAPVVGAVSINSVDGNAINARPSSEVRPEVYEIAVGINTDLTLSGGGGNYGSEYSLRGKEKEGSKANNNGGDKAPFHYAGTPAGGDVSINIASGDVIIAQPSSDASPDGYEGAGLNTNAILGGSNHCRKGRKKGRSKTKHMGGGKVKFHNEKPEMRKEKPEMTQCRNYDLVLGLVE